MSEGKFEPEMTVNEALAFHPAARWVFTAWHLGGCANCEASSEETLAQVAEGYKLPLNKFLGDLNSLLDAIGQSQKTIEAADHVVELGG